LRIVWKQVFTAFFLGVLVQGAIYNNPGIIQDSFQNNSSQLNNVSDLDEAIDGQFSDLNESQAEKLIHQKVNEERSERGLERLEYSQKLEEIAKYHSNDMVERNYYAHKGPNGESMSNRYEKFNYNCRVSEGGFTDRYYTGAENIDKTFWRQNLASSTGISYIDNEKKLAEHVVSQWMNSQGHRENILKPYWNYEGIGVSKSSTEEILVTQNFC